MKSKNNSFFNLSSQDQKELNNKTSSGKIIKNSQTLEKLATIGSDSDQHNAKNTVQMKRRCTYLNCDSSGNLSGKYKNHYSLSNCPLYNKVKHHT